MKDSLEQFADWFLGEPLALLRPPMFGIHYFGDLMSVILFRDKEFQAELFIVRPGATERCGEHGHPDVDSMEVAISGEIYFTLEGQLIFPRRESRQIAADGASAKYGHRVRVLPNQSHTAFVGKDGACFLSLQQWLNGVEPTSIGLNWSGEEHAAEHKEKYGLTKR